MCGKCERKKRYRRGRKTTSGTLDTLFLNGFLLKAFTVMSLIKQLVGKMGSEDEGCIAIVLREKNR